MKIKQILTVMLIAFLPMVLNAQDQKVNKQSEVYDKVEVMPEFDGGNDALITFIAQNVKYPKDAVKKDIQGKVFVSFVVEKDGSVGRVQIERSVDPLLDKEAIRVVKNMPSWKPGMEKGKPAAVQYTMPINFALSDKKKDCNN